MGVLCRLLPTTRRCYSRKLGAKTFTLSTGKSHEIRLIAFQAEPGQPVIKSIATWRTRLLTSCNQLHGSMTEEQSLNHSSYFRHSPPLSKCRLCVITKTSCTKGFSFDCRPINCYQLHNSFGVQVDAEHRDLPEYGAVCNR